MVRVSRGKTISGPAIFPSASNACTRASRIRLHSVPKGNLITKFLALCNEKYMGGGRGRDENGWTVKDYSREGERGSIIVKSCSIPCTLSLIEMVSLSSCHLPPPLRSVCTNYSRVGDIRILTAMYFKLRRSNGDRCKRECKRSRKYIEMEFLLAEFFYGPRREP